MPNWIQNTIWVENAEDLDKVRKALRYKGRFSYNAVDPMPPALNIDAKADLCRKEAKMAVTLVQSSHAAGFKGLHPYLDDLRREYASDPKHPHTTAAFKAWLLLEKPEVLRYGQQLIENGRKYGYETWYEWSLDHWGVKWDASGAEVDKDRLMIRWESPWSAPIPIIRMVSEKLPDVTFKHEWCDLDDTKGWYTQEWSGGKVISEDFEPDPDYEEEKEDSLAVARRDHPDSMFLFP